MQRLVRSDFLVDCVTGKGIEDSFVPPVVEVGRFLFGATTLVCGLGPSKTAGVIQTSLTRASDVVGGCVSLVVWVPKEHK